MKHINLNVKRSDHANDYIVWAEGYDEEHEERVYRHIGCGVRKDYAILDWMTKVRYDADSMLLFTVEHL